MNNAEPKPSLKLDLRKSSDMHTSVSPSASRASSLTSSGSCASSDNSDSVEHSSSFSTDSSGTISDSAVLSSSDALELPPAASSDQVQLSKKTNVKQETVSGTDYYLKGPINANFFHRLLIRSGASVVVDQFLSGLHMFEETLRADVAMQLSRSKSQKPRFIWKNSGEISEDFSILCDCVASLARQVRGNHEEIRDVLYHVCKFLMEYMGYEETYISLSCYQMKVRDYLQGGTRYSKDQKSANVEFASRDKRMKKLHLYMQSNESRRVPIGSTVVYSEIVPDKRTRRPIVRSPKRKTSNHSQANRKEVAKRIITLKDKKKPNPSAISSEVRDENKSRNGPSLMQQYNRLRIILGEHGTELSGSRLLMLEPFILLCRSTTDNILRIRLLRAFELCQDEIVYRRLEEMGIIKQILIPWAKLACSFNVEDARAAFKLPEDSAQKETLRSVMQILHRFPYIQSNTIPGLITWTQDMLSSFSTQESKPASLDREQISLTVNSLDSESKDIYDSIQMLHDRLTERQKVEPIEKSVRSDIPQTDNVPILDASTSYTEKDSITLQSENTVVETSSSHLASSVGQNVIISSRDPRRLLQSMFAPDGN